jgi:hypothetical protein
MARPKTKSSLVEGISELVGSLRSIEFNLGQLLKVQKSTVKRRGRGRPPGSIGKRRPGSGRGPGRPPGAKNKKITGTPSIIKSAGKVGRPAVKRRGRPAGSKNKK